jgi:hypothetical protein
LGCQRTTITGTMLTPCKEAASARAAASCSRRTPANTMKPFLARARAALAPMPVDAPVTKAAVQKGMEPGMLGGWETTHTHSFLGQACARDSGLEGAGAIARGLEAFKPSGWGAPHHPNVLQKARRARCNHHLALRIF